MAEFEEKLLASIPKSPSLPKRPGSEELPFAELPRIDLSQQFRERDRMRAFYEHWLEISLQTGGALSGVAARYEEVRTGSSPDAFEKLKESCRGLAQIREAYTALIKDPRVTESPLYGSSVPSAERLIRTLAPLEKLQGEGFTGLREMLDFSRQLELAKGVFSELKTITEITRYLLQQIREQEKEERPIRIPQQKGPNSRIVSG